MNSEKDFSVESSENAELFPKVNILVVDGDSTCLKIISGMLHSFGYKVMTANQGTDALRITREREHELDLILTEVRLPDMEKYELLETLGETSNLPVIIMSADDDENAALGGLLKGAVFYLKKPIDMNDIKNIWQFAYDNGRRGRD